MSRKAQFLPSINFLFPEGADRLRSGMVTRYICSELSRFPESFGIRRIVQPSVNLASKDRETCFLVPRACTVMKGALVAAGGSVLSLIEREAMNTYVSYDPQDGNVIGRCGFASSDVDFYVRAGCAESRRAVVNEVLRNVMPPVGKVVRTQFAISWEAKLDDVYGIRHRYCEGGAVLWRFKGGEKVVRVQIINRTLPHSEDAAADINLIFNDYDFDCCQWAFDDRGLYSTERSYKALHTRICIIPFGRISDSLVSRMARYYKRCYDFEIEGSPFQYPKACAEVISIVRSGNAAEGVRHLPLSGYDYASICERERDVLFTQLKAFGAGGQAPYAICATPEEADQIVASGLQASAPQYWFQWYMRTMNRMCELITWMALSDASDKDAMQQACLRSLDAWKNVLFALELYPMFEIEPPFNLCTTEVFNRYWIGERTERSIYLV